LLGKISNNGNTIFNGFGHSETLGKHAMLLYYVSAGIPTKKMISITPTEGKYIPGSLGSPA
jgi:hypothetical protein